MTRSTALHILVVDDKPALYDQVKRKVSDLGADLMRSDPPYSFPEVAKTAATWADIIILDLGLNEWEATVDKKLAGFQLCKWLRGEQPPESDLTAPEKAKLETIPIIIYTSQLGSETLKSLAAQEDPSTGVLVNAKYKFEVFYKHRPPDEGIDFQSLIVQLLGRFGVQA